jgi:integrase
MPLLRQPQPFAFHDFRHSYGTLAVQICPVTDVQIYMGHERIERNLALHREPKWPLECAVTRSFPLTREKAPQHGAS